MRPHRAYLLGSILGLVILAVGRSLQAVPVVASPHIPAIDLNRALKGDRLLVVAPAESLTAPGGQLRLPEGCEASVSSMTRSSLAHTPARCLS